MHHQTSLERIRAEFLEMPGLRLTLAQTQRLCGLERPTCQTALDALVTAKFLCRKPDGSYARSSDGAIVRPRPAKAGVSAKGTSAAAVLTAIAQAAIA